MKFHVIKCNDDQRYDYVEKVLAEDGHEIVEPENAEAVVFPMFASKDGVHITGTDIVLEDFLKRIPENAIRFGGVANFPVTDYLMKDTFRPANAMPTAEGALAVAMMNCPVTVSNMKAMVIGYGCVADHLCRMLKALGADVTVSARNEVRLAKAKSCGYHAVPLSQIRPAFENKDVVFNTVPARLFDEEDMKYIDKNSLFIEIAVGVGCMDIEKAKEMGINYRFEPKLPGRLSPRTAAMAIVESIYDSL